MGPLQRRQLATSFGAYEVSTAHVWVTESDNSGRDPHVSFLALRHWRKLASSSEAIDTVDSVCAAIAGLDREAVEWPLIDGTAGLIGSAIEANQMTRLLAEIVRQVVLPARCLCD